MPASLPAGRRGLREGRSFAAVAESHLDDVYRYVVYLTGDRDLAEDLTGETFERALRRWRRFDPRRGSAKTWLCQLARGATLDHFRSEERRRRRETVYASADPREGQAVYGEGLSPVLERALAALSAAEREVVALRVVLELEGEAAARVLGISPTACSTRLSRALKKLAERVKSDVRA
jgi:RNA polymerase sigma-70 factor (ECF subfamily)